MNRRQAEALVERPRLFNLIPTRVYMSRDTARVDEVANAPTIEDVMTDRRISEADRMRLTHQIAVISGAWKIAWDALRESWTPHSDFRAVLARQMGRMIDATDEARRIADGIRPMDTPIDGETTLGDIALTRETAGKLLSVWLMRDARGAAVGHWSRADVEFLSALINVLETQRAMIRAYQAQDSTQVSA